jgi:hypothetical protein
VGSSGIERHRAASSGIEAASSGIEAASKRELKTEN